MATVQFDALPHIDAQPSATELSAARALLTQTLQEDLQQEIQNDTIDYSHVPLHPGLSPAKDFGEHVLAMLQGMEDAKTQNGGKLECVEMSRYEEVERPSLNASVEEITSAVQRAAISSIYLEHRAKNLAKLNEEGKDDWLAGNAGIQVISEGLEKELASTKESIDVLAHERRSAQEAVRGEIEVLEQSWRGGVERVLRTEVGAEELRSEILELRRTGGGNVQ